MSEPWIWVRDGDNHAQSGVVYDGTTPSSRLAASAAPSLTSPRARCRVMTLVCRPRGGSMRGDPDRLEIARLVDGCHRTRSHAYQVTKA